MLQQISVHLIAYHTFMKIRLLYLLSLGQEYHNTKIQIPSGYLYCGIPGRNYQDKSSAEVQQYDKHQNISCHI